MTEQTNTLEAVLKQAIDSFLVQLNTSIPAKVTKVGVDGTVTVTPVIQKVRVNGTTYTMPSIVGVPILYANSAGYSVTFPLTVGDEGILIVQQRDISKFMTLSAISPPIVLRQHDLADSVFLPTAISNKERPTIQNSDGLELIDKAGGAKIQLVGGNVNLTGTLFINGVPYLAHTHTTVGIGDPTTGVNAP